MGLSHGLSGRPARILPMESFIMSAAVPWIGVFMLHRSAKDRFTQSEERISGRYRLRPKQVSAYMHLAAAAFVLSCHPARRG